MQRSNGPVGSRRRAWTLRGLLGLLVVAAVVLPGAGSPPPARDLRLASATDPAPPTGVVAAGADRALAVSWTAPAGETATGYRVYVDGVDAGTTTTTSYTVPNLVNGRSYVVTVVTRSMVLGLQTEGTQASAPATGIPRDAVAPAAPTGVTAVRGDGRVEVSWAPNTGDYDVDAYRVLRDGAPVSAVLLGRSTARWSDATVVNDVTYAYAVQTRDTSGNWSAPSTPAASATPTDLTPPAAPTGLVGGRGDGRAGLAWNPNGEPDLAGYRLLRDGVDVAAVTATQHVDEGLQNDRTYVYTVVAVDTHGNRSAPSAPVSVTPTDLTAPGAPTGLTAVRGDTEVGLTWTPNPEPDVASYVLRRDGVSVATVTGSTSYTDTGLTNDTTYRYTVAAVDAHGNVSVSSADASATPTDLGAPATPTGLTATAGDREVTLSWTAVADADVAGYVLLRDGTEIATVTGTTYTDAGLTSGRAYGYAVLAVDGHGNRSAASPVVSATPVDATPPAVPTGLTAVRGDGRVTLSWTANGEPDLAGYVVLQDGVEVATVSDTTWVATGLVNDRSHGFALVAVDTSGNRSARSAEVSATPTDLTAPATPTGLVVTRPAGDNELTWTANGEPDLASYRVLRDGVEIATVTGTSYFDTAGGSKSGYSLVAVDTAGNRSGASAPVTSRADVTPPAAPTGLVATRGDSQVSLSWAANGERDLADYRVLRDGVEIATVTGTTYVATGLVNDVTYHFSLIAVDVSGNRSAAGPAVPATPTDLTPPAAPRGLVAVAGDRQVTLSWTANGESDLAGYRVLRDGVEVATVSGTTWTDAGRTNDVTYTYSLVAVDAHGNRSAVSATASATPRDMAPAAPTDLAATPGDRRAVLTWTAPADPDVVAYRVLREDGTVAAAVDAPTTQVAVPGLVNGTSYRFTVVAVDAGGNVSAPSGAVTVVPASPPVPVQGAGGSGGLAVSADGRYVVVGTAARLEAADTNTAYELHLLDRTAGTARRLAPLPAAASGATDPTNTSAPAISADGRTIALATRAALVPGDTNGQADVYRYDTASSAWSLVSVPTDGRVHGTTAGAVLHTGSSVYATSPPVALSADGDLALFYSARSDLVAGDTNGVVDLFAKRISTGVVTRVSTTTTGGNLGAATGPALEITPDGRFALFPAAAPDGTVLLYRKTLSGAGAGELVVVSQVPRPGGAVPFGVFRDSGDIAISDDGRYVALVTASRITTSTPGAVGTTGLAYRIDLTTRAVLPLGNGQQNVWEHQVELDPTGRFAFFSTASGQLPADTNGHTDHYRRDLDGGVLGPLVLVTTDADGRVTGGPIGSVMPSEYGRLTALTADRVVVTTSQALVSADTNRVRDLYLKDLATGAVSSPLG